jgi:hypothetical protein
MRILLLLAALLWHGASAQPTTFEVVTNIHAPFTVTATVDRDPTGNTIPVYQVGDSLSITMQTDRDAFVYVFNVRADGTVALFFPNELDTDNFLRANRSRVLPGSGYTLDLKEPIGLDKIFALASTERLDTFALLRVTQGAIFASADLNERAFAQALTGLLRTRNVDSWAAYTAAFYIGEVAAPTELGIIRIDSLPLAATVYLNDIAQGNTPLTLIGGLGRYSLRVETAGYTPYVETFDLTADGRHIVAVLQQEPSIGRLDVRVNVLGATLLLNGFPYLLADGVRFTFPDLLGGEYELTVTAPCHRSRITPVTITPGRSHELIVELAPIQNSTGRQQCR